MSKLVTIFNVAGECVCQEDSPLSFMVGKITAVLIVKDEEGTYKITYPLCNISEIREAVYYDD